MPLHNGRPSPYLSGPNLALNGSESVLKNTKNNISILKISKTIGAQDFAWISLSAAEGETKGAG